MIRMDPGFGYARILLVSQLQDSSFNSQRIRIVGSYSHFLWILL